MTKASLKINGQSFEVWLAITPDQQERGLMQVTEEQLADFPDPLTSGAFIRRGMLFVFTGERPLSFWMYNTITALDIAYIDAQGRIVKTYTMAPLETHLYPSIAPAMYALEARAGLFSQLGITEGMPVELPESVLKGGS